MSNSALLQLDRVSKRYSVRRGILRQRGVHWVHAVDDVSFALAPGETLSLVGESGCGKTTTARMVLRVVEPTSGSILFDGCEVAGLRGEALKQYRASVQAVFQDPWSSLDPRMKAGAIVAEPMRVHKRLSKAESRELVAALLRQVGLSAEHADLYPHQFSGGQRQRIAIARALSIRPRLVVLDEPVSALDVSIRAQILNILKDLQEQLGLSYLLIAHQLATVRHMSHQMAVMYLGQIVERAPTRELFANPLHPYTRALQAAALASDPWRPLPPLQLSGEVPSAVNPPTGCRFHPRCPTATPLCADVEPELREVTPGHWVRTCPCVAL